jgi:hypothetical protein
METGNSSSMFQSAYDDIPLENNSTSSSDLDNDKLPFIRESRIPIRRNTPPILSVESESLYESRTGNNNVSRQSRSILPELELEFNESRESYYWRWISFGIPAFYGILLAFVSTVRTFAGYHDYMTRFSFWWAFTSGIGVVAFLAYTRWRKQRDEHFLSWWSERPLHNPNYFNDNL